MRRSSETCLKAKTRPKLGPSDMAVSVLQRQLEEQTLRKLTISEVSETRLKQDEGKKLLAYQGAGISEYWIVDVAAKIVKIHRLTQAKTYFEETHANGAIALQAFPDVTIDIGNLF
jgi:hypothetical protein